MNKNIGLGILLGLGMVALPVEAQNVYELTTKGGEDNLYQTSETGWNGS